MKKKSMTKTAFIILLLHLAYIVCFAFSLLIATLLEVPCERSGIYEIFAVGAISMLISYPVAGTAINIFSVIFQIRAIRNNESKVKNIIMMIVTILLEAVVILFFVRFWQGAMSV